MITNAEIKNILLNEIDKKLQDAQAALQVVAEGYRDTIREIVDSKNFADYFHARIGAELTDETLTVSLWYTSINENCKDEDLKEFEFQFWMGKKDIHCTCMIYMPNTSESPSEVDEVEGLQALIDEYVSLQYLR